MGNHYFAVSITYMTVSRKTHMLLRKSLLERARVPHIMGVILLWNTFTMGWHDELPNL
jgi:hypothetical protein